MIMRGKHHEAIKLIVESTLTFKEIARRVGVSERTLSRWVNERETFRDALKECQLHKRFRFREACDQAVGLLVTKLIESVQVMETSQILDFIKELERLQKLEEQNARRSD